MTCKDCFYYEDMCKEHLIECAEHGEAERILNPCSKFKNKADFVEVVRCKDCRRCEIVIDQFDNDWYFCTKTIDNAEVKHDDFCSYGERKKS